MSADRASSLRARVRSVCEALFPPSDPDAEQRLWIWVETLLAWNARMDLTAARDDDELVDLLVADAAVLAREIDGGSRVVDVGSGAGAPGLALALLRPDLHVTLVEPLDKRVGFLRTVLGKLGGAVPRHVAVIRGRGEDLVARGAAHEVAVARATLPPQPWLQLGAKLAPHGAVWVLLARADLPRISGWEADRDLAYVWPLTRSDRRAARFRPIKAP